MDKPYFLYGKVTEQTSTIKVNKDKSNLLDKDGNPIVKEEGDPDAEPVYSFEGAGRDWKAEYDEEYKTGHQQDLSKTRGGEKTLWQNLKEFPKKFTQKVGSFWENRVVKELEKTGNTKGLELFAIIQTIAGMGKNAWMQGTDLGNTKRLLQQNTNITSKY